jgi:hypothetical protein
MTERARFLDRRERRAKEEAKRVLPLGERAGDEPYTPSLSGVKNLSRNADIPKLSHMFITQKSRSFFDSSKGLCYKPGRMRFRTRQIPEKEFLP